MKLSERVPRGLRAAGRTVGEEIRFRSRYSAAVLSGGSKALARWSTSSSRIEVVIAELSVGDVDAMPSTCMAATLTPSS
jgi:hypothetical protein